MARRRRVAGTAVVATLSFAGCSSDGGSPSSSIADALDGRRFVITTDTEVNADVRLRFDDGRLEVNAGCNEHTGRYSIDDDVLSYRGESVTAGDCIEPESFEIVDDVLRSDPEVVLNASDDLELVAGDVSLIAVAR